MVTDAKRVTWSRTGYVQSFCLKSAVKELSHTNPPFDLGARTESVQGAEWSAGVILSWGNTLHVTDATRRSRAPTQTVCIASCSSAAGTCMRSVAGNLSKNSVCRALCQVWLSLNCWEIPLTFLKVISHKSFITWPCQDEMQFARVMFKRAVSGLHF